MTWIKEFSPAVVEKIGYYVYLLIDPETGQEFYVGKGNGNRIFAHLNAAVKDPTASDKLERIRSIQAKGLMVEHAVLRHGLTEKEAFEVEAAMIDHIGLQDLENKVVGQGSQDRGKMSIAEVIAKYEAPAVVITEPVILIRANQLYRRGMSADKLYETTRGNWVLGERREKAKYAFAVYDSIVREVYEIHSWTQVTARQATQKILARWRFEGCVAKALQHYVGGSVADYMPAGAQNPIRYVNC